MSFDLRQVRAFRAIAENGSFSRAAREIGLTQPTLSTHVKNLEEGMGVRLFDRAGKKVTLTPAGEVFLDYARQMLGLAEGARQAVTSFLGEVAGEVALLASTVPAEYILPRWLGSYRERFPRVRISLGVSDTQGVVDALLAGGTQVGVAGSEIRHPALSCRPLTRDEVALVASPALLSRLQLPARLTPAALARLPLIRREEGSGTQRSVEEALKARKVEPGTLTWVATFGSTQAALEGARAGVGAAFLPLRVAGRDLAEGSLRKVDPAPPIRRSFYLLLPSQRTLSPVARHLADTLWAERSSL